MKRIFLLLILCSLLTGCSGKLVFQDYREIDQLDLVQTLGIDREGELAAVTASTTSSGGQMVLHNRSITVARAIREMQNYTEKKYIFYGHTAHLLLGEQEAKQGLGRCLEFVERDSEIRLDTDLYIVQGETAEKAIAACSQGESSVGDLLDSLNKDVQLMSESYVFTCGETAEALEQQNCALVSSVKLYDSAELLEGGKGQSLQSSGYAIVTKTQLLGYLDRNLSRGANLLMDKVGSDVIEANCGDIEVAARLTGSDSHYQPQFQNGELTGLQIRITLRCNIDDLLPPEQTMDERLLSQMETAIGEVELDRVLTVLQRSQALNADFCGLKLRVRQAAPLRFDRMQRTWDEIFSELPIETTVEVKLERTYDAGFQRKERE